MIGIEKRYEFLFILVLSFAIYLSPAQAIDAIPRNVVAPPPDYNGFLTSVISIQTGDKYTQGREQGTDIEVDSSGLLLRYTRSFLLAGQPAAFYLQPTLGCVEPGGSMAGNDGSAPRAKP